MQVLTERDQERLRFQQEKFAASQVGLVVYCLNGADCRHGINPMRPRHIKLFQWLGRCGTLL
jgi:hypothetical protein